MTQVEGWRNFSLNVRTTMLKIRNGEKLTKSELNDVVEFYLEVVDYLSKVK